MLSRHFSCAMSLIIRVPEMMVTGKHMLLRQGAIADSDQIVPAHRLISTVAFAYSTNSFSQNLPTFAHINVPKTF